MISTPIDRRRVANEAAAYGYEAENRHFVCAFLGLEPRRLTFDDGLDVVELFRGGPCGS